MATEVSSGSSWQTAEPGKSRCGPLCPGPHLTQRECDIAEAITTHKTVKSAANALQLSPETVKSHLKTLKAKLGVKWNSEIFRVAAARGIFTATIDPPTLSGCTCLAPPQVRPYNQADGELHDSIRSA